MYFHHNHNLAWISIAKNACSSWSKVFDDLGWIKEDLFDPTADLSQLTFFGFLRWPEIRHTMGVTEYLKRTNQQSLLSDPRVNRLFVSGVFDQHCYSVSQMIPDSVLDRTTFFIIDQTYYNYETLTRRFLAQHGVVINGDIPRVYAADDGVLATRKQLNDLKLQYPEEHGLLTKNFLERDVKLYNHHLALQPQWHRPGDVCGQSQVQR